MKRIFSILLVVALLCAVCFCAVACNDDEQPKEFERVTTLDKEPDVLFGKDKAFTLMDKATNFSVEYTTQEGDEQSAGIAKLVLDTTEKENFVSVYANGSMKDDEGVVNSIAYMFLTWEENRKGDMEKTLVSVSSFSGGDVDEEPIWDAYTENELESSVGAPIKAYHKSLIANCGANHGTRYIREEIYNQNDDVYDTIKASMKEIYSDEALTKLVRTEITITYSYLNDEEKAVNGTATIVLENKEVDFVDGQNATALVITSITIVEEGGYNLSAKYTYGVYSLDAPTEENYLTSWPEAYPLS